MSSAPPVRHGYETERSTWGGITYLKMRGTLSNDFEGRKLAGLIGNTKVVISMREVQRFASWGMSEWMEFLRMCADRDLYVVDCSTYAVSQLTLVTGLLGHAKLVSFYASYRCSGCGEEIQRLFLIPKERADIRDMPMSTAVCPACSGRARLEEYPAAFFDTIAARPAFDIDDEVLAFMRTQLSYDLSPDLTRFRAFRRTQKGNTYLRLTGNIATLPSELLASQSEGTTLVDLDGVVFEPGHLVGWRNYVMAARSHAKSLHMMNCPPGFLEHAFEVDDFSDKVKVRSFNVAHDCGTCGRQSIHNIDVATHLEDLVMGRMPPASCPSCRSALPPRISPALAQVLVALPARDRDPVLDAFLTKVKGEPSEKLENCLTAETRAKLPNAPEKSGAKGLYFAFAAAIIVLGAAALVAPRLWKQQEAPRTVQPITQPTPNPQQFKRPDWIVADTPGTAYCHDMVNRLMCVGVSLYRAGKEEGVAEATDAALDELVSAVGLRISDAFFKDTIIPAYSDARAKGLTALQTADLERGSDPQPAVTLAADEGVRKARRRVVEDLQASGGAAVPTQRSDWYWEEYVREKGQGTEFLVFVRFDVPMESVKNLVERYSTTTTVMGSTVMTAFPALGWQSSSFKGGALVVKAAPPLSTAGLAPQQIVSAVGTQHVTDATGFQKALEAGTGQIKLTVVTGDAPEQVIMVNK